MAQMFSNLNKLIPSESCSLPVSGLAHLYQPEGNENCCAGRNQLWMGGTERCGLESFEGRTGELALKPSSSLTML